MHYTAHRGAVASLHFEGNEVALVSSYGPDRGRVVVTVDGVRAGVVDLYRPTRSFRQIVFLQHLTRAGSHNVALRVLGPTNPSSTGRRVDLDALLTMTTGQPSRP